MPIVEKMKSFASSGSLKDSLKDYLENCSIAGCMYYFAPGTRPKERIFWLTAHIVCLIYLGFMTVNATLEFWNSPTVTTEDTTRYPNRKIPFPSVAICDVNKISYSAAVELAEDILEYKNVTNSTQQEVTEMLKYLGHLYVYELNDGEKEIVEQLHQLLIRRYGNYLPSVLKKLVPSCRDMMQYCSWHGREEACEDIFSVHLTGDGWCCTFNHIRRTPRFGRVEDGPAIRSFLAGVERLDMPGSQFGLTVLIRSDIKNHYYKTLPVTGFKILINSPIDYADGTSGGTREFLVSPGTESAITLEAVPFYSVPEVKRYSLPERRCLFNDEWLNRFGRSYYSFTDCITNCKTLVVTENCNCVPFFHLNFMRRLVLPPVCDLRHLPCLRKYRARFLRVLSKAERKLKPNQMFPYEFEGFASCIACISTCEDVVYHASVSSAPVTVQTVSMGRKIYEIDGHSIVNIFFKHTDTIGLKHDVLFEWYDLLSNYGGFCGLFLGTSVISIAEFLYFFTIRFYKRKHKTDRERDSGIIFVEGANESLPELYWTEMQPNPKR